MTNKDFEKLGGRLLPRMPGFEAKGRLLFIPPVTHTLRAVCFDGSDFDRSLFFVHVFLQPMFVPATHIILNLGWRVGGGSHRWSVKAPGLEDALSAAVTLEGLPFLTRIKSPEDVVQAVHSLQKPADPYALQAIAYAWVRGGNVARASEGLERLVSLLDRSTLWQREMSDRAEALKSQLLADFSGAQRQLDKWEKETIENLGLERASGHV